jgi:hypothetical protein
LQLVEVESFRLVVEEWSWQQVEVGFFLLVVVG